MGREIRKVPPNWQHPKPEDGSRNRGYQPMHDQTFAGAAKDWKDEYAAWERGERPSWFSPETHEPDIQFWEWNGEPPDRKYYRAYSDDEATWFQLYETVSEGTPVSPPFATKAELVEYLVTNGDFWDQKRGDGPWSKAAAERMVESEWAPSMIVTGAGTGNATISTPRDMDKL